MKQTVQCEVLRDIGHTVKDSVDIVTQYLQKVQCVILTYVGHTVADSSGHSDTEPKDGTV